MSRAAKRTTRSRKRRKRSTVAVEDRTFVRPSVRLHRASERLLLLDKARYMRLVEIAETYVAIYDRPDESSAEFEARLSRMRPGSVTLN